MFRQLNSQPLKSITLSFNIDKDEKLIKAIAAYHKTWDIVDVNGHTSVPGEGFVPFKCGYLQQVLTKLKNRASLADDVTIHCQGYAVDCSLETMMPNIQSSSLLIAHASLTEDEVHQAYTGAEKVVEFIAGHIPEIHCMINPSFRRNQKATVTSVMLEKLNRYQVMLLLNEVKDHFAAIGASIKGLHFLHLNKIVFQPSGKHVQRAQNYVLSYDEPCCLRIMQPVTFEVDKGFHSDNKENVDADIIAELQDYYSGWKDAGYNGPVISDSQSGFNYVAQAKADKLVNQLIQPAAQTFFGKLPADLKQLLKPNVAGQFNETPTADIADCFLRKVKTQTINLAFYFPDTSFRFHLDQVYKTNKELIVVSSLQRGGGGGEMMVLASDSMTVQTNEDRILPVKHYAVSNIKSKQVYNSEGGDQVNLVNSLEQIPELRDKAGCELLTVVGESKFQARQRQLEELRPNAVKKPS